MDEKELARFKGCMQRNMASAERCVSRVILSPKRMAKICRNTLKVCQALREAWAENERLRGLLAGMRKQHCLDTEQLAELREELGKMAALIMGTGGKDELRGEETVGESADKEV